MYTQICAHVQRCLCKTVQNCVSLSLHLLFRSALIAGSYSKFTAINSSSAALSPIVSVLGIVDAVKLPETLKQSDSLTTFKKELKRSYSNWNINF